MEAGHYKVIIYLNQSHVSQTILTFPVTFTAHPLPPPWEKKKYLSIQFQKHLVNPY